MTTFRRHNNMLRKLLVRHESVEENGAGEINVSLSLALINS
jgi:hypothetical protein